MAKSMHMGGCIVSKNILNKVAPVRWCFREEGVNAQDNGWRFLSAIDSDDYLNDPGNMAVCDWGTIVEIEPAVQLIFNLPYGAELVLEHEPNGKKAFIDPRNGRRFELPEQM